VGAAASERDLPTAARDRNPASPRSRSRRLEAVAEESATCTRCDLYREATQTVFGEGPVGARMMLVGEQRGDREDLEGEPFVGPAGGLLTSVLEDAGIAQRDAYVTNAVKHFKFERRGKRRIHQKPNVAEMAACHPWYEAELELVQPEVVVGLGATATRAVLGRAVTLRSVQGQVLDGPDGVPVVATLHPSAVLRAPESADRHALRQRLVDDLILAAQVGSGD
jgi:uracil-DNA glycosylase